MQSTLVRVLNAINKREFFLISYEFCPSRESDSMVAFSADYFIVGFRYHPETKRFRAELHKLFARLNLELHSGKTRFIEFSHYVEHNCVDG